MDKLKTFYNNNLITTIIQTNMSAAFNTVDHLILSEKLDHYEIRGELEIFKYFLDN